jgi:hypothetical protein
MGAVDVVGGQVGERTAGVVFVLDPLGYHTYHHA